MIAHWMLYCAAVATLAAAGGWLAERALGALGRPTRWAWAGALLASLALPAVAVVRAALPDPAPAAALPAAEAVGETTLELPAAGVAAVAERWTPRVPDGAFGLAWAGSALLAAAWLGGAAALLTLRRRRWHRRAVDGVPVRVAPDAGPAVVGFVRPEVVLPRWVVEDADPDARALMLAHELEHVRARDPQLVLAALAAVCLMPWNPALAWQLRRLRLAVEVDCDARVLARRPDVRAYGALLLEVGRRAAGIRLAAAAFSEPASFLERRIRTMTAPFVRPSRRRAAALVLAATGLVVAACETPAPTQIAPRGLYDVEGATPSAQSGVDPAVLRAAVARHLPGRLENGGEGALAFVADARGEVLVVSTLPVSPRPERVTVTEDAGGVRVSAMPTRTVLADTSVLARIDPSTIERVDVSHRPAGEVGPNEEKVIWVQLREGVSLADAMTAASGATGSTGPATVRIRAAGTPAAGDTLRGVVVTGRGQGTAPSGATVTLRGTPSGAGGTVVVGQAGQGVRQDTARIRPLLRRVVESRHPELLRAPASEPLFVILNADGSVHSSSVGNADRLNGQEIARVDVVKGEAVGVPGLNGGAIIVTRKP